LLIINRPIDNIVATHRQEAGMTDHPIVSHEAWLEARKALLAQEKEFSRLRDRLAEARRALPWEPVEKTYVFDSPAGKETLAQLFADKSQLVVYHFMYDPNWEWGCKSCSFWADNYERNVVHLEARDVSLVAVSRAPLAKLEAMKRRMGWTFKWLSASDGDFAYDYGASFRPEDLAKGEITYNYRRRPSKMTDLPGISVFYRDAWGAIFHTYSTYERGLDMMNAAYMTLDLCPKGRDEAALPYSQAWVQFRDSYDS
jgi:predicted dithiol-disulfide oxidoreductase (DUF899 family)